MKSPVKSAKSTVLLFGCAVVYLAAHMPGSAVDSAALHGKAATIGSRLQLLVDATSIAKMVNARQVLHRPRDRGIVFHFDKPWEGPQSAYVTILQHGDQYRMYYRGGGDLGREYACMAVSTDSIHWERPSLGLFEFRSSTANNIIWTGKKKAYFEAHNFAPFLDRNPDALASQRYKAVTLSRNRDGKRGLVAFVSPDGIHWQRLRDAPILTEGGFDSHNTAFWDVVQKKYICYFRTSREGKRSISRSTSSDFLHWTKPVPLDFGDTPLEHLYTNGIVPYFRELSWYLGFPMRFIPPSERNTIGLEERKTDGFSDAVFMSSRDGLHWDRTFMEAFIRPGIEPSLWGGAHGNQTPAWGILPAGDHEIALYWSENYSDYPKRDRIPRLRRGTVRLDGFISVRFPYEGGELVTRPVIFEGSRLVLNYATSAAGSARVEIQNADGKALPGFRLDECIAFWGNEIERVVAWRGGRDVSELAGRPVRLRFVMRDADLYSYRFRP